MDKDQKIIWEAYENPPMSQGGWSSKEVENYYGSPKVTDVKVGGSENYSDSSRGPSDQEVAAVVDQFEQLLSGQDGGFLRGVTIPAIDNIFDELIQRWDMENPRSAYFNHMVTFWIQIIRNIQKHDATILSAYLLEGEPQGHYFNVEYARALSNHIRNLWRNPGAQGYGKSGKAVPS